MVDSQRLATAIRHLGHLARPEAVAVFVAGLCGSVTEVRTRADASGELAPLPTGAAGGRMGSGGYGFLPTQPV